ncbi:hypothetical protein GCM10009069_04890 [Algimonas arctica]|uniref:CHAT domain-containing protein n=1 Tax=Algimonas arctica TaxID=1479486 RepID=A0A8J3CQJ4_9PROT|nr:hypothetical protein GCM10009069_04890 [Algimonas arctica]
MLTIYPDPHPEISVIEMHIAETYFYVGNITKAAAAFEDQIAIIEQAGPDYTSDLMGLYNNVGVAYNYLSRHEDARKNAQLVLNYRKAEFDALADPFNQVAVVSELATAFNNLAASDMELALYDSAIFNIGEAIQLADKMSPPPPTAALWYANLPVYLRKAGRDQEAIVAARKAAIKIEMLLPKDHPFGANNLSNLGALLTEKGKLNEAERVTRKALRIASAAHGRKSEQAAAFQLSMAQILLSRGQHEPARQFAEAARATLEDTSGAGSDKEVLARQKIASSFASEDLSIAIALQSIVVTDFKKSNSGENRELIVARELLADHLIQAERYKEAKAVITENYSYKSRLYAQTSVEILLAKSREIYVDAALKDGSFTQDRLLALLGDVETKNLVSSISAASLNSNSIYIKKIYGYLFMASLIAENDEVSFRIAQHMLSSAAGNAVTINQLRDSISKPSSRELLIEIQDLAEDKVSAERTYSDLMLAAEEDPLKKQQTLIDRLEADIAAKTSALFDIEDSLSTRLSAAGKPVRALQNELDDNVVQIGYLSFQDRLYAISLTSNQVTITALDGRALDLNALSDRVRASVTLPRFGGTPAPFDGQASQSLYGMLFPTAMQSVLAGKTTLEIIPSAILDDLPFTLLQTDEPEGEYLIDRMAISISPKFGGKRIRSKKVTGQDAPSMNGVSGDFDVTDLTVADMAASRSVSDGQGIKSLPALPGAKNEIYKIAEALNAKKAILLSGVDSTETKFKRLDLDTVDIFAFATHGVMTDEIEGLDEPALVFNRSNIGLEAKDDGFLTSSEITKLNLNADWVILSACNTAAPNETGAASYEGLTRAFLYAGADSLLVSHWPVRDDAAAFLTVNTVQNAQTGMSKAEALQKAILDLRRNKDIPDANHPAIWAPFVLIGN